MFSEKPVRVLCVFGALDFGGAESMCMQLYRHIDRSKVQFDFVTHSGPGGAYEEEIRALGGKIYYCPRYKIINHLTYQTWWRHHLAAHPEHKIIHGHYFSISAVYFRVAHEFNCITIGHSHCVEPSGKRLNKRIFNYYCSKVSDQSDYCFACSKDAGNYLFPDKTFHILNNAIDVSHFVYNAAVRTQMRNVLGIGHKFVIGHIGRFTCEKNHRFIIDVFKKILEINKESVLVLIGDGPLKETIMDVAKENGIEKSILFLGVRDDVPQLLQALDVFFFPSLFEGLGIVAVEAQAAGLPVVCSDVIPDEVTITTLVERLSLKESVEVWRDSLLKYSQPYEHLNTKQQIIDAGYDIQSTVKYMETFYLSLGNRHSVT